MDYDWRKLVENASYEKEATPFFQAVHILARHTFGIKYEDRNDFAQFVCLMMLKDGTLSRLLSNNFSNGAIFYRIKTYIKWRTGDWFRTHGKIEPEKLKSLEDCSEEEETEFYSEKAPQYELFFKEDVLLIKKLVRKIIPAIGESKMRADAKENTVKAFLLSQIFLGEFFEDYTLSAVVKMLKTDLSQYEINESEVGQYTIEGVAKRLGISTTAVSKSIFRIREIGVALARQADLNNPSV